MVVVWGLKLNKACFKRIHNKIWELKGKLVVIWKIKIKYF